MRRSGSTAQRVADSGENAGAPSRLLSKDRVNHDGRKKAQRRIGNGIHERRLFCHAELLEDIPQSTEVPDEP